MVTIKEYATSCNKSVQAVYQQMKRKENSEALEGHVFTRKINNKNTKMLDEIAVDILDESSKQSPLVVTQVENTEEIEKLRNENKNLLLKIAELQESLLAEKTALLNEKDQVKLLQQEKINLIEQKNNKKGFFSKFRGDKWF